MSLEVRSVSDGIEPEFERAWNGRLARAPHANFTFSLDYLAHEAANGVNARLVLVDEGPLRGAIVLREEGRELVCGFPWRTQALVEGADPTRPEGSTPAEADRLFEAAGRVAGRNRLRFHTPFPHGGAAGCHPAGSTVMVALAPGEDGLLAAMNRDKRAWIRRATRRGVEVSEHLDLERQRRFAAILDEVHVRRHGLDPNPPGETPPPGEGWRTWERPWHAALFALLGGRVVAGLGWGRFAGGMIDGRANGTSEEGRRHGAGILLIWEALRRARAAGHTWVNFGGSTAFKREFGGIVMPIHGRLGGGIEWLAPNLVENLVRGEGRRVAKAMLGRLGDGGPHAPSGTRRPAGSLLR